MMGVIDNVFDILDPACKGFLTASEVQQYDEALHFTPLCLQHIESSIKQLCGATAQGCVTRTNLLQVLQDLERRRRLEEQLRWDFMGLDQSGAALLPLKQVLMLFTMVHGDDFSMQTWQTFLDSRGEKKNEDVYFDEIKVLLCAFPEGPKASSKEILQEQRRLDLLKREQINTDVFRCLKTKEFDDLQIAREKQDYEESTRKLARRKLNTWERDGVEGLIYDDGLDHGEEVSAAARGHIGIIEVTDALQVKYDLLRKRLFWNMLKHSIGEAAFELLDDTEKIERFQQLHMQEAQMREEGFLDTQATELPGASMPHTYNLYYYTGELRDMHGKRKNDMYTERLRLRAQRKTDVEIDKILKEDHDKELKGPVTCADMLIELDTRYLQEKQWINSKLKSDAVNKWSTKMLLTEYCCMTREQMLADLEADFYSACIAVGVTEREQEYKPERYDPDRSRQEYLARTRLLRYKQGHKSEFPYEDPEFNRDKSKSNVEIKLDIVKEILWKHIMEREALAGYLLGPESKHLKQSMSKMPEEQRTKYLTSLRNQRNKWREYNKGYRASQREAHVKIVNEGSILYFEYSRQDLFKIYNKKEVTDEVVCASVLADLQQKQDIEFYALMHQIQPKSDIEELLSVKTDEKKARREEVFDNIASVVLGTEKWTDEEIPFMEAVEAKYFELRRLLFSHVLELEHGVSWHRLPERDRLRFMERKTSEEEKLRNAGQFDPMANLIQRMPHDTGSLRDLMGEDRAEYSRRMKDLNEFREQSAITGQQLDARLLDEKPTGQVNPKAINLLADMVNRSRMEEDAVVGFMRNRSDLSLQERMVPLVQLKIERRRAERQEQFDAAALSIGFMERIVSFTEEGFVHKTDQNRQLKLAFVRVEGRRRRMEAGRLYQPEINESPPETGDTIGLMEGYIKERDKKHTEEREILLNILQESGFEDLYEAAKTITDEEKHQRLAELQVKRRKMNMHNREDQDENISILEEAAAIRFVLKRASLEKEHKRDFTKDEVSAYLLAEVQDEQDKEMGGAISRLGKMELEDLELARTLEIELRQWGAAENVVYVLTQYEGSAQDKQILTALEEKYDAMREHVLQDILSQDENYMKLSGPEKHRKLVHMTIQEKKLRKEGNLSDMIRLLGGKKPRNQDSLSTWLGETRTQYEKRLKKIASGIPSASEEDEYSTSANVFELLQERYDLEKKTVLAVIRGTSGVMILGEGQREVMIVRLHYEKRLIRKQTQLSAALLAVGLADRQQPDVDRRNLTDRWRQEKLADLSFDVISTSKYKANSDIVKNGSGTTLKEAVMQHLQDKHWQESAMLLDFLKNKVKEDVLEFAENMSEIERQNKLKELKESRSGIPAEKTKDQHAYLSEAVVYKKISRGLSLKHQQSDSSDEISETEVVISILADLLERQFMECEQYLQKLAQNTDTDLITMQSNIVNEKKIQAIANVAEVLLSSEDSKQAGDHQLIQALENKYDTLRDKLLSEALMSQLGENEWQRLSERDRQRKLVELRMKERKLRKEGRVEEANKLIGDSIDQSENLQRLLATSREEYERRIAEKRAKRQQRKAEGFTEEEVDQLEAEEAEEEKKKGVNVLADLDACFEKEKEALLKALTQYREGMESDKTRQLELARLKRDQRRAQEEEKFSAAALYISMANEQKEVLEDHRKRQEDLAKQRLAEKMKQRKQKRLLTVESEVPAPENQSDVMGWMEAIMKEVELKHADEREVLMQLLNDPEVQTQRVKARDMNDEAKDKRHAELRLLRDYWKDGGCIDSNQHTDILKEATGISLEIISSTKLEGSDENVVILANLQEQQDHDMARLTDNLSDKSSQSLKQLKTSQEVARKQKWYENLAAVILSAKGKSQRKFGQSGPGMKELMDGLEKKYDAAMDKLMEQALRQQIGDQKWFQLSERDKKSHIVKLKLQNRQLRHQGKYEEANQLFGELIFDSDLSNKLGDSRSRQRKIKEGRLQRKKQLMADRKQQGLSVSDPVLEALLDEMDKNNATTQKKNILDQLQEHFDDEKELLTTTITNCDSGADADTLIQLELARLVRERKQLAEEEEFGTAVALLNMIDQKERHKDAVQASDLDNQKTVATARLCARMKNYVHITSQEQLQKDEAQRQADQAKLVDLLQSQDIVTIHASILREMELRQEREREHLIDLIYEATHSQNTINWVQKLSPEDRKFELEKARQGRAKWKTSCLQHLAQNMEANKDISHLSSEETNELIKMREEQHQLLLNALACRAHMDMERLESTNSSLSAEQLAEEIGVKLMVELQHKQLLDSNAVTKVANEKAKDEFRLKQLLDTQISSTREGWMDNLVSVIFTISASVEIEIDEEGQMDDDESVVTDALDEELKQEKEALIMQLTSEGKSQEYILGQVRKLEQQQEERKESLMAVLEKQKAQKKNKQMGRRQTEANREYEDDIAMQMSKMANRELSFIQKLNPKFMMKDEMSERIQARREARKREAMLVTPPDGSAKRRSRSLPHPGGLGLKREKTVIDVPLTDDQISEKQKQLMRDVAARNRQIAMEQRIHEDRLQKRLQEMKQKRTLGVQEVFSTMERQRSDLEAVQLDERARQLQRTREDVQRRREQQTQDMKRRVSQTASQFEDLQSKAVVSDTTASQFEDVQSKAIVDTITEENADYKDDESKNPIKMKVPQLQLVSKDGVTYTSNDPLLEQSNLAAKRIVKSDETQYDIV